MNTEPSKVELLEAEVRHLENQRNGFSQAGLEVLSTLNRVEKERDALKREVKSLTSQLAEARKDSERVDKLSQFFDFDQLDFDESAQRTCYGWIIRDESLTEALGGSLGLPDPLPTFRQAIDALPPAPTK